MSNTITNLNLIREVAWVLATASGTKQVEVPGEYIWARLGSNNFADVRSRQASIFSSGNSIKDDAVMTFIQDQNLATYLLDPWSVNKFEEHFPSWISAGNRHELQGFDQFKYTGFSAGSQESFINFFLVNRQKRFRIFKGEYWWHMEVLTSIGADWKYIEDDDIRPNDVCICSCPFALSGSKHTQFDWLVTNCNNVGVEILVDFIYLPNSISPVTVDLRADCIKQITFSLSKTFPVQCAKIAVRMCKEKPSDPLQISNDENIGNRLSAGLALAVINKFPMDYNVIKYEALQKFWCDRLGLTPSGVVHFGTGADYITNRWYSKFNDQRNRYNLGMLYENQNLLSKLGYA